MKRSMLALGWVVTLLNSNPIATSNQHHSDSYHVWHILSNQNTKQEFAGFVDNVLRQVPSSVFFDHIVPLLSDKPQTDAELYEKMLSVISTIKPRFSLYRQLQALHHQKKILTAQAKELMQGQPVINGCLEIGQPATYVQNMKSFLKIRGPIYSMIEQRSFTDYLQAGSLKPYDTFIPLNNYEPIKEDVIPGQSVDLIVCFIGLHHIPKEKLEPFIASLKRVLRPGGTLLLRDHDAHSSDLVSMVHAAHTIFNALMPTLSLQEELDEYRNFQPLSYWIDLLTAQGFKATDKRLTQEGDPTLNTMIAFTHEAQNSQDAVVQLSNQATHDSTYQREGIQSQLTTPEWVNVDVSQDYGAFIEHTPFYEYPYWANVKCFWRTFAQSWKAASKRKGTVAVLKSPYTLMNLFIGTTMTIEYGAKSIISWPLRMMYSGQEIGTIKAIIEDPLNQISAIDTRIKVLQNNGSTKLIELPRYKEFVSVIKKIAQHPITFHEIAGQKEIQCKVRYNINQAALLKEISGCTQEYSWQLPTQPTMVYTALCVSIPQLATVIKELAAREIELVYIHDF